MKRLFYFSCLILCTVCYSCSGTKNMTSEGSTEALDTLVLGKKFRVVNQWASPMVTMAMMSISGLLEPQNNIQRINLMGNPNYLEIKGDSVKAYLPYFGERQMGGGYDPEGGAIRFDQEAVGMNIDYLESKGLYRMRFRANKDSESFNAILEIYPNRKTMLLLNSTQRNPIRYEGVIAPLPEK